MKKNFMFLLLGLVIGSGSTYFIAPLMNKGTQANEIAPSPSNKVGNQKNIPASTKDLMLIFGSNTLDKAEPHAIRISHLEKDNVTITKPPYSRFILQLPSLKDPNIEYIVDQRLKWIFSVSSEGSTLSLPDFKPVATEWKEMRKVGAHPSDTGFLLWANLKTGEIEKPDFPGLSIDEVKAKINNSNHNQNDKAMYLKVAQNCIENKELIGNCFSPGGIEIRIKKRSHDGQILESKTLSMLAPVGH